MAASAHQITGLLVSWRKGDKAALDQLMPLVYDELHRLAHRYMKRERPGQTLQTTALVNEAYLRLVELRYFGGLSVEEADLEEPGQSRSPVQLGCF